MSFSHFLSAYLHAHPLPDLQVDSAIPEPLERFRANWRFLRELCEEFNTVVSFHEKEIFATDLSMKPPLKLHSMFYLKDLEGFCFHLRGEVCIENWEASTQKEVYQRAKELGYEGIQMHCIQRTHDLFPLTARPPSYMTWKASFEKAWMDHTLQTSSQVKTSCRL